MSAVVVPPADEFVHSTISQQALDNHYCADIAEIPVFETDDETVNALTLGSD
jgi:TPP-dependent indolepyruvate ferredoxin oxidoreductase alpha subunit